jgi:DNA-binding MarR family transcriptional regulator
MARYQRIVRGSHPGTNRGVGRSWSGVVGTHHLPVTARLRHVVHVMMYYCAVREPSIPTVDADLVAADLLRMFRPSPAGVPGDLARDLTLLQLRLLFVLNREGPQPMGRIALRFDLTSAAASGLVERIERHGLVERRHRDDDRRVVECALSPAGQRLVEEFAGIRLGELRRTVSVLAPDELAAFHRLVRIIGSRQVDR